MKRISSIFFKDLLRVLLSLSAFIEVVPLTPHDVIYQTRISVFDHISKQRAERDQSMTCNGAFLTNFEVLGNVVKHCLEYLIYLFN